MCTPTLYSVLRRARRQPEALPHTTTTTTTTTAAAAAAVALAQSPGPFPNAPATGMQCTNETGPSILAPLPGVMVLCATASVLRTASGPRVRALAAVRERRATIGNEPATVHTRTREARRRLAAVAPITPAAGQRTTHTHTHTHTPHPRAQDKTLFACFWRGFFIYYLFPLSRCAANETRPSPCPQTRPGQQARPGPP